VEAKPSQDASTIRFLRRGIGIVGILLPIVLVAGTAVTEGSALPGSLSGSYYTWARDIFVGGVWAIGVFLVCYRRRPLDDLLSTAAGLFAIAVAVFPTAPDQSTTTVASSAKMVAAVHYVSASLLFALLAVFCLVLFTAIDPARAVTPQKLIRNRVYRTCGVVILVAMALALASGFLPLSVRDSLKPMLICEAVAVFAFGVAWLVKGETIFRDSLSTSDEPAILAVEEPLPAQLT
jgi:hypothetical protein